MKGATSEAIFSGICSPQFFWCGICVETISRASRQPLLYWAERAKLD